MRRAATRQGGMTLLEILLVITIIGIMLALFGLSYVRSIRSAELREAAAQVATDFRRARSQVQRSSMTDQPTSWCE